MGLGKMEMCPAILLIMWLGDLGNRGSQKENALQWDDCDVDSPDWFNVALYA